MRYRLSLPPSFSNKAEKLGWTIIDYQIHENRVLLIQDDYRLTFWIDETETKLWDLHRHSSINGWHLIHRMVHPGTERIVEILKMSHKVMNKLTDQDELLIHKKPNKNIAPKGRPNTILLVGVRRSGNHGLLNWLIGNLSGKVVHINALDHRDLKFEMYEDYSRKDAEKYNSGTGFRYPEIESSELIYSEGKWVNFHDADWLILSLESVKVKQYKHNIIHFCDSIKCHSIILLRDPLNNAASMYKSRKSKGSTDEMVNSSVGHVLQCWEQHAMEMIENNPFWTSRVLFNRWISDRDYRDQIMLELGCINSDSGFGRISGHGRSSFDQNQDDAAKLDLEGRYKSLILDQGFVLSVAKTGIDSKLWQSVCKKHHYSIRAEYLEAVNRFPKPNSNP